MEDQKLKYMTIHTSVQCFLGERNACLLKQIFHQEIFSQFLPAELIHHPSCLATHSRFRAVVIDRFVAYFNHTWELIKCYSLLFCQLPNQKVTLNFFLILLQNFYHNSIIIIYRLKSLIISIKCLSYLPTHFLISSIKCVRRKTYFVKGKLK